jgi:hypothetical protein
LKNPNKESCTLFNSIQFHILFKKFQAQEVYLLIKSIQTYLNVFEWLKNVTVHFGSAQVSRAMHLVPSWTPVPLLRATCFGIVRHPMAMGYYCRVAQAPPSSLMHTVPPPPFLPSFPPFRQEAAGTASI